MVSYRERVKLMRQYRREPACVLGLMLKCAAGLLMIAGAALIGIQTGTGRGPTAAELSGQPREDAGVERGANEPHFTSPQGAGPAVTWPTLPDPLAGMPPVTAHGERPSPPDIRSAGDGHVD